MGNSIKIMKRKMLIFKHRIAEKMNKYYMNKLRKWAKIDYDCCSKLKDDNGDDNSRQNRNSI